MKQSHDDALQEALSALKSVEDQGGVCDCKFDKDKISSIFVSTSSMISNLKAHRPDLVLLDTTFGTNVDKYKLAMFVYPCRRTNRTRVAAFAFLSDERDANVGFMLQQFHSLYQPKYFFVDKDFHQLRMLKRIFLESTVFLCIFHVLKYMRSVIATLNAPVDDLPAFKQELFATLKRLIHSRDAEAFAQNKAAWLEMVKGTVKVGGKLKSLEEYFQSNWLDENDDGGHYLWATYHRRGKPLLFTNTSNRIESYFAALKKDMLGRKMTKARLAGFIPYLLSFITRREFSLDVKVKRFRPNDSRFHNELSEASLKLTE